MPKPMQFRFQTLKTYFRFKPSGGFWKYYKFQIHQMKLVQRHARRTR